MKHGYSNTRTYHVWEAMIQRCENPNHVRYHRYGGRGIKICKRWRNSFTAFLKDMGERPSGKSLDRIHPDRDYKPSNCRWATREEQEANKKHCGNQHGTFCKKTGRKIA